MFLPFVLFFWVVLLCAAVWGFIDALVTALEQGGQRDPGTAQPPASRGYAEESRPRRHGWRRPHHAG